MDITTKQLMDIISFTAEAISQNSEKLHDLTDQQKENIFYILFDSELTEQVVAHINAIIQAQKINRTYKQIYQTEECKYGTVEVEQGYVTIISKWSNSPLIHIHLDSNISIDENIQNAVKTLDKYFE